MLHCILPHWTSFPWKYCNDSLLLLRQWGLIICSNQRTIAKVGRLSFCVWFAEFMNSHATFWKTDVLLFTSQVNCFYCGKKQVRINGVLQISYSSSAILILVLSVLYPVCSITLLVVIYVRSVGLVETLRMEVDSDVFTFTLHFIISMIYCISQNDTADVFLLLRNFQMIQQEWKCFRAILVMMFFAHLIKIRQSFPLHLYAWIPCI